MTGQVYPNSCTPPAFSILWKSCDLTCCFRANLLRQSNINSLEFRHQLQNFLANTSCFPLSFPSVFLLLQTDFWMYDLDCFAFPFCLSILYSTSFLFVQQLYHTSIPSMFTSRCSPLAINMLRNENKEILFLDPDKSSCIQWLFRCLYTEVYTLATEGMSSGPPTLVYYHPEWLSESRIPQLLLTLYICNKELKGLIH